MRHGAGGRTGRARRSASRRRRPFGGVWQMSFVSERETYGFAAAPFQERRRTLSFSFADWMTGTTRWEVGLARERWPDGPATGVLAGARYQTIDDRFVGGRAERRSGTIAAPSGWRRPASNGARRPATKARCCWPGRRPASPARERRFCHGAAQGPDRAATNCFGRTRCCTTASFATRCSGAGWSAAAWSGGDGARRSNACCASLRRSSSTSRAPTMCRVRRSSRARRRRRGAAPRHSRCGCAADRCCRRRARWKVGFLSRVDAIALISSGDSRSQRAFTGGPGGPHRLSQQPTRKAASQVRAESGIYLEVSPWTLTLALL